MHRSRWRKIRQGNWDNCGNNESVAEKGNDTKALEGLKLPRNNSDEKDDQKRTTDEIADPWQVGKGKEKGKAKPLEKAVAKRKKRSEGIFESSQPDDKTFRRTIKRSQGFDASQLQQFDVLLRFYQLTEIEKLLQFVAIVEYGRNFDA